MKKTLRSLLLFIFSVICIATIHGTNAYAAESPKYIYFGYSIVSELNNDISSQLENKENGLYEINGQTYKVINRYVYSTIPIKWRILEETNDRLLLIQDYVLTGHNFSDSTDGSTVSWENSDVREYLNDTYYNGHFTDEEKKAIVLNDNGDRLFLPSADEIEKYFPTAEERTAHYYSWNTPDVTTPIVGFGIGNAYNKTNYTCAYWTRTASKTNYSFSQPTYVTCDGYITSGGRVYNTWSSGVRPMMYIEKSPKAYDDAPESVTFSTEKQIIVHAGDKVEQPIYAEIKGGDSYRACITRSKIVTDKTECIGLQKAYSYIDGEGPTTVSLETKVYVKPEIETISASAKNEDGKSYIEITWNNTVPSAAYEIVRSTSKDGGYETVYNGTLGWTTTENGNLFTFQDKTAVVGQEYWYKVRGLWRLWSQERNYYYDSSYNGIETDFSNSANAKIVEKSETEDNKEGNKEDTKEQIDMDADTAKYYNINTNGGTWDGTYYYLASGQMVRNSFFSDGTYTYYLQADGTPMRDRLTYHPDGKHVIYFDSYGHEVFSDFANVTMSIAGTAVDDMCFFDTYGYMYVDTLTYDKTGTKLYYVNPYGVLERNGWFQFSGNEFDAGLGFSGKAGGYGYANSDCSLLTNTYTYDSDGNYVYVQGDGHVTY